ncbi:hypothetical protein FHS95_001891 [Sphingomonas naasensis]|uniref:hypothetical protein n=1 Tax=Sphingomonas naasensis TaxID=1344951 RepID=UPI00141B2043|nr:hypothetical protein [Sphingomonas naasensis]NIJ20199.1 hypothetical protein [Sphingomonas naasensis]
MIVPVGTTERQIFFSLAGGGVCGCPASWANALPERQTKTIIAKPRLNITPIPRL